MSTSPGAVFGVAIGKRSRIVEPLSADGFDAPARLLGAANVAMVKTTGIASFTAMADPDTFKDASSHAALLRDGW
jgi:hypothetical protein